MPLGCARPVEDENNKILEGSALASPYGYDPSSQTLLPSGRNVALNQALLKAVLMPETSEGHELVQVLREEEVNMGQDVQEKLQGIAFVENKRS